MPASAAIKHHESAKPAPIEVFRERCEARAQLVAHGLSVGRPPAWCGPRLPPLIEAVDELQESAAAQGLLKEFGQDAIQQIMSESFARWRF